MILSEDQIREAQGEGDLSIQPFDAGRVGPAYYELAAGEAAAATSAAGPVDLGSGSLMLEAGGFALLTTREEMRIGRTVVGRMALHFVLARKGLLATMAPQLPPGYHGRPVLGLYNPTQRPLEIRAGDDLAIVEFHKMAEAVEHGARKDPYQGRLGLDDADLEAVAGGG